MQAFIYLRVSSQGQLDRHGPDRQLAACKKAAKRLGYTVAGVYLENVSGTKDEAERPKFQSLVAECLADDVKTIIVEDLTRLARAYGVQETLLIYLASKGIDLINASTLENVTEAIMDNPTKKLLVQIQGSIAEWERSQLVMRLRRGRERVRKEKGKCEGRKGFGEDYQEKDILRRMRALLRRRKDGRSRTNQEVADLLNSEGLTTKMGCVWTRQAVWGVLNARH